MEKEIASCRIRLIQNTGSSVHTSFSAILFDLPTTSTNDVISFASFIRRHHFSPASLFCRNRVIGLGFDRVIDLC